MYTNQQKWSRIGRTIKSLNKLMKIIDKFETLELDVIDHAEQELLSNIIPKTTRTYGIFENLIFFHARDHFCEALYCTVLLEEKW